MTSPAVPVERATPPDAHPDRGRGAFSPSRPSQILPPSLAPRGLSRAQAAAYIGVSASLFDSMIEDGRMPVPKVVNARRVWDRLALDAAFSLLPNADSDGAARNPWDE